MGAKDYIWIVQPILFTSIVWFLYFDTERVKAFAPRLLFWYDSISNEDVGLVQKVWRVITFVRVLYCCGIVGFIFTFYDVLCRVLTPIIEFIRRFSTIDIHDIIEHVIYLICCQLVIESTRYSVITGVFIALLALSAFCGIFIFSLSKYQRKVKDEILINLIFGMPLVVFTPMALHFQSGFLGFLTVGILYNFLGFRVIPFHLGLMIGFKNDNTMYQLMITSFFVTSLFAFCRYFLLESQLKPFVYGVFVFGPICYFLGGLIISSSWGVYKNEIEVYYFKQFLMMLSLMIITAVGALYEIDTFFNIGVTFMVLYMLEKIVESHLFSKNFVLAVFLLSCCCFGCAFYLSTHPLFISKLFDANVLL